MSEGHFKDGVSPSLDIGQRLFESRRFKISRDVVPGLSAIRELAPCEPRVPQGRQAVSLVLFGWRQPRLAGWLRPQLRIRDA